MKNIKKHYYSLSHVTWVYNEKRERINPLLTRSYYEGIIIIYLGNALELEPVDVVKRLRYET